jgi:hypothetical protein
MGICGRGKLGGGRNRQIGMVGSRGLLVALGQCVPRSARRSLLPRCREMGRRVPVCAVSEERRKISGLANRSFPRVCRWSFFSQLNTPREDKNIYN